ncbi:MAG: family 20 glycosylhydrolase, partial [Octadecabacter sp.]
MTLHLSQTWTAAPAGTAGTLTLTLHNTGPDPIAPTTFCYTSLARIDETTQVSGGTVTRIQGSFVEVVPDADIAAGGTWELRMTGLIYTARTRTQGVLTAWFTTKSGQVHEATLDDLHPLDDVDPGTGKHWPAGEIDLPLGILPWPADVKIDAWEDTPAVLRPAAGSDKGPFQTATALHRRLFPSAPAVFSLSTGRPVTMQADADVPADGYRLTFDTAQITLAHSNPQGALHGLVALAQIAHAARTDPRFKFPTAGLISDAPRFAWRGLMLDVSRNFHSMDTHLRLLDIMAWMRMNRFHWHLIDDEGWRMPSKAYPELNQKGAARGPNLPMPSQYRDGPNGQAGYLTEADIATVLSHAATHGIAVMPEVEMPGHAASLIASIPGLRDPQEPNDTYRSVQGFTNNALNPGIPLSYEVAQTLLDEAIELFPFDTVHVGADEVEISAWQN